MMDSLPDGYTAAVFGATGGLGAALIGHLAQDRRCGRLVGLSRSGRAPAQRPPGPAAKAPRWSRTTAARLGSRVHPVVTSVPDA